MDKNMSALLDANACTIRVRYQHDEDNSEGYIYVNPDKNIQVGDVVLVTTTNRQPKPWAKEMLGEIYPLRLSVGFVIKVDADVQIEPNAEIRYHWVVAKLDLAKFHDLLKRNGEVEQVLGEAYKQNLRRSFASQALGGLPDDVKNRVALSLGHDPLK